MTAASPLAESRSSSQAMRPPAAQQMPSADDAQAAAVVLLPAVDDYYAAARRPLNSLIFVAPFLACYELGTLWLYHGQSEELRNGADAWLRLGLSQCGVSPAWLLPALVIGLLLAAQLWGRHRWSLSTATFCGMTAESVLFACGLVVIGQFAMLAGSTETMPESAGSGTAGSVGTSPAMLPRLVCYLGAGIYEEVLFRLCLIPAITILFAPARMPRPFSLALAVFLSSLMFAIAHYVGPGGDEFLFGPFLFRLLAGLTFAILYQVRGFGVAVGCHAMYDILVGILLFG